MNLIEFMSFIKDECKLYDFLESNYPEIEDDDVFLYLKSSFSAESEIAIFDYSKIGDPLNYE